MRSKDELRFTSVPKTVLGTSPVIRGKGTPIQWTWRYDRTEQVFDQGQTFNAWWGCDEVSPACDFCYAREWSKRRGIGWGADAKRHFFQDAYWKQLERWNDMAINDDYRIKVFTSSMCDVFEILKPAHEQKQELKDNQQRLVVAIQKNDSLDYLTLTKRPKNIPRVLKGSGLLDELNQLWIGITTEDQKWFDIRWPSIKDYPNILFLSCEPLLGRIDLPNSFLDLGGRVWIISGGESGSNARDYELEHWRHLRNQCQEAKVPIFHKQYGSCPVFDGRLVLKDGHSGNTEHWFPEDRVREWPR